MRRGRKHTIFALGYKLLKTVFGLMHRGDYYRDADVGYEAMSVKRNALRWRKTLRDYGFIQT